MTAANFAANAKLAPNPATSRHIGPLAPGYICHMAGMHWAFMDLGDTQAVANDRIGAINRAICLACVANNLGGLHGTITSQWYGNNMCAGTVAIPDRAALYAAVAVGDVLILPSPQMPQHTLVVVQKSTWFGRTFVYVRGFNNHGTLGTGQQNAYDDSDRDIDVARYWHNPPVAALPGAAVVQHFGQSYNTGGPLYRIPYATYSQSAATLRNRCNGAGAQMTYVAPP